MLTYTLSTRTSDPIPHFRLGRYVRSLWESSIDLDFNQAVSWPLLSPHVVADEPVMRRPHMPLSQYPEICAQFVQNRDER